MYNAYAARILFYLACCECISRFIFSSLALHRKQQVTATASTARQRCRRRRWRLKKLNLSPRRTYKFCSALHTKPSTRIYANKSMHTYGYDTAQKKMKKRTKDLQPKERMKRMSIMWKNNKKIREIIFEWRQGERNCKENWKLRRKKIVRFKTDAWMLFIQIEAYWERGSESWRERACFRMHITFGSHSFDRNK